MIQPLLKKLVRRVLEARVTRKPACQARLQVEELESRTVPYGVTGNLWPHPESITLSFVPDGTNLGGVTSNLVSTWNARFGSAAAWQNVILKAAQQWAQQTNINFAVVKDNGADIGSGSNLQGDPNFGDIRIGGYNFGLGNGGTLAAADFSPSANNYSVGGDITFNTGQSWNINGNYDIFSVALHEIGHALGLDHSKDSSAIMYQAYTGVETGLAGDDIAGIRNIYSKNAGRTPDPYDAAAANDSFSTATGITPKINTKTLTALVTNLDLTTTSDVDFYKFTVPAGSDGTLAVRVQSAGLSLLSPKVWVYDANQNQLGTASGLNKYGTTLTVNLTGISSGKTYYVKVDGADAAAFGTGSYALALDMGSSSTPTASSPNTTTPNGTPLHTGGGLGEENLLGVLLNPILGLLGGGIFDGYGDLYSAVPEVASHGTLDSAQDIGNLSEAATSAVFGSIGNGPQGAAEVDWYSFNLSRASAVFLDTGSSSSVLGLYNNDPFDFNDPYDPLGHRLAQSASPIEARLAPGTYYVAVSGNGNRDFNPFLDGSGSPGDTGAYALRLNAVPLSPGVSPIVLSADPAPDAVVFQSPFVIRLDLSGPIDPDSVSVGDNVTLTRTLGPGREQDVPLAGFNYSDAATELQFTPAPPLAPGSYRLHLRDILPESNYMMSFRVAGVEGEARTTANDTPATAVALGDLTGTGVRVAGAVGDDPTDSVPFNPADVDLYSFTVSGLGRQALTAEVFAGRIGSPLDAAVSLYQAIPGDPFLYLIGSNNNSLNTTPATNGTIPLFADPVMFAGLTAGSYYLAVSSSHTTFDPNLAHSGQGGSSTGDYVLRLGVQSDNEAPQVVNSTLADGAVLSAPPTTFTVQFSEAVNLPEQAVFVQGADGARSYPRLTSWDATTGQATFMMLDGLANGDYVLNVSGSSGVTDHAGNPLGDVQVRFSVNGPVRGTDGNPLLWANPGENADLGVLFPHELQFGAGVTIMRSSDSSTDSYRFEVLQSRPYFFNLEGSGSTGSLAVLDADGNFVPAAVSDDGTVTQAYLQAGTYTVRVETSGAAYQIHITLGGADENPTPLTAGPAPTLRIRLSDRAAPELPLPTRDAITPLGSKPAFSSDATPALGRIPPGSFASLAEGPVGGVGASPSLSMQGLALRQRMFPDRTSTQPAVFLPGSASSKQDLDEASLDASTSSGTTEAIPSPVTIFATLAYQPPVSLELQGTLPMTAADIPEPAAPVKDVVVAGLTLEQDSEQVRESAGVWHYALAGILALSSGFATVRGWRSRTRRGTTPEVQG